MAKNRSITHAEPSTRNTRGFSDGMTAVVRDFPFYSVGSDINLKGLLVDCVDMPPQTIKPTAEYPTGKKPWKALIFVLTMATEVRSRDGEVSMASIGDYVGVGMSASLMDLEAVARHPSETIEIELFAEEKIDIGEGRTFRPWKYATGTTSARSHQLLAQKSDAVPVTRQLGAGVVPNGAPIAAGAGQVALSDN